MEGYTVEEVSNRHGEAPPLIRVTRHSNGDTDTFGADDFWNLNYATAIFVLPRLVALRDEGYSYPAPPMAHEEWDSILDAMIYSFEALVDEFNEHDEVPADYEKVQEGLTLFGKYFMALWS